MFNFSNVKELIIPEGVVTKIVSAGRTLWESIVWSVIYGDSPAYAQTVPPECRSDNKVNKIGGKSVVVNQLLKNNDFSQGSAEWYKTIAIDCEYGNGQVVMTRTNASEHVNFAQAIDSVINHKYYVYCDIMPNFYLQSCNLFVNSTSQIVADTILANTWKRCTAIITPNSDSAKRVLFYITNTNMSYGDKLTLKNFNCIDLTQMFGAGNEPTLAECKEIFTEDYYPYNAGELVSTTSKKLVSKGRNLYNPIDTPINVGGVTNQLGHQILERGTYTVSLKCSNSKTNIYVMDGMYAGGNYIALIYNNNKLTFTLDKDTDVYLKTYDTKHSSLDDVWDVQIEESTEATDYVPYRQPVELVTDYGVLRSAGSVYDYVDLDRAVIVRRVGTVDLGSLSYGKYDITQGTMFRATIPSMVDVYDNLNLVCAKYTTTKDSARVNGGISQTTNSQIDIVDTSYTDTTSFKSAMNGVKLYYELATPVEEPITVKGNTLSVEAGGTLTFVNDTDYHLPVPNEVEYYVQLDEIENLVNTMYLSDLEELENDL